MKELIEIQKTLKAPKGQLNKFGNFKYRSCEDILEALKPLLYENKCVLTINDDIVSVVVICFQNCIFVLTATANPFHNYYF